MGKDKEPLESPFAIAFSGGLAYVIGRSKSANGISGSNSIAGGENHMGFLAWIILGLVAGFIGSKVVNKTGEGFFLDIILGVIGAVVGGWLFTRFGAHGVTGLNLYSFGVAVVGAIVVLVVFHAIRRTV